jgi:LysM repeat protein
MAVAAVPLALWLGIAITACDAGGALAPPVISSTKPVPYHPKTISIYDVALQETAGAQDLANVVASSVLPREVVIGSGEQTNDVTVYIVAVQGDSLVKLAAKYHISLQVIESANEQLGPIGGRNFNLIYPGDRIAIPVGPSSTQPQNFVATRLPIGPTPPNLRIPYKCGSDLNYLEYTQCRKKISHDKSANTQKIAGYWAAEKERLGPAQKSLVEQLQAISPQQGASDPNDVGTAVQMAANSLTQLPGRRVLLISDETSGPPAMSSRELADIHLVLTGVQDPQVETTWKTAAVRANVASVVVLDPALTQLQLPTSVNG